MILAILAYSIVAGLSAFARNWVSFAVLRFLVGIAIGSEWVRGVSIAVELWPDRARGRGVGLMQRAFGIGFFLDLLFGRLPARSVPIRGASYSSTVGLQ
jgi:MFS family permease